METDVTPVSDAQADAPEPTVAPQGDGNEELAAAKALADERYAELQYARAEIENVRKRALRIADDRLSAARRQLLVKFLPVLDNLQRATAFGESADLRGGLQATLKGFEALLASEGLVPTQTVGKPFDPRLAEAVTTRESSEHDDDVVVEELQPGYLLGEELVRPALVIVAKRVDPPAGVPPHE